MQIYLKVVILNQSVIYFIKALNRSQYTPHLVPTADYHVLIQAVMGYLFIVYIFNSRSGLLIHAKNT